MTYDLGEVAIFVYSPLVTGSSGIDSVDIEVYIHFEKVHMYGTVVPQMGKKTSTTDREKKAGSVSTSLAAVGESLGTIAKIPLLSSVALPASWAVNAMSGAAAAFGWSKPFSDDGVKRMINTPAIYLTNDAGVD